MNTKFISIVLLTVGLAGCDSDLERAQHQEKLAESAHEHELEMQRLNVEYVETDEGPIAAQGLKLCYMEGFPTEGTGTFPTSMSHRERAKCQAIIDTMHKTEAQQAAAKRKADAAYDKAHPEK